MVAIAPRYVLLTETRSFSDEPGGFWRFLLRQLDGSDALEASEVERDFRGVRLELLAAIRGLEAIGEPATVTLVTTSRYVASGIRRDLRSWREMSWMWERFGELHPIRHLDLWQRLDHALRYHTVRCQTGEFESRRSSALAERDVSKRKQECAVATTAVQQRDSRARRAHQAGFSVVDRWLHQVACRLGDGVPVESLAPLG
jgi:ribonuclease HI